MFASWLLTFPKFKVVCSPIWMVVVLISVILPNRYVLLLIFPIWITELFVPINKLALESLSIPFILTVLMLRRSTAGTTMLYPDDAFEKLIIFKGGLSTLVVNTLNPAVVFNCSRIPES